MHICTCISFYSNRIQIQNRNHADIYTHSARTHTYVVGKIVMHTAHKVVICVISILLNGEKIPKKNASELFLTLHFLFARLPPVHFICVTGNARILFIKM